MTGAFDGCCDRPRPVKSTTSALESEELGDAERYFSESRSRAGDRINVSDVEVGLWSEVTDANVRVLRA